MNEENFISKLVDGTSAPAHLPFSRIDKILGSMTPMPRIKDELIRIKDQVANSKDEAANADKINGEVI